MSLNAKKLSKVLTGVIFFTLIGKLLGFFRELLLSYYFGATEISDAYLISQNIPGTIFQFVGTGLMTCFIPIYYKILKDNGKNECDKFTNKIISLIFIFSTIIVLIVFMNTSLIVKLFASGFKGESLKYAINFTRINIFGLYFSTILYVYNSYLQANKVFVPTAFSTIPNSLFIMLSIYLGAKYNIYFLAVGSTLAVAFQLLFLIYPIKKLHFKLKLNLKFNDKNIKEIFRLMIPVIIGVSVNEINTLVDRTIASQVSVGAISALTYSNSLIMLIQNGFVQQIATIFYPQITSFITAGDEISAKNVMQKMISLVLTILIPISVIFIVFGYNIVDVLFGRGAFDKSATSMTAIAICFYSIGICFMGLRELLSRYYYAYSDTKTPMYNAAIGVIVNIVLNLLLSKFIGIAGLALATSISAFITTSLLLINCRKKFNSGKIKLNFKEIVKITIGSIIMGLVSYFIYYKLVIGKFFRLVISVLVGVIVYILYAIAVRLELYYEIKGIFKNHKKENN